MTARLTLIQPAPRRPASYGASSAFTITPSCPRASASSRKRSASSGSSVTILGTRTSSGNRSSRAAKRSVAGRSIRSSPSRWRMSKTNGDSGYSVWNSVRSFRLRLPNRLIVRPKGWGRRSGRSAIASASRTAASSGTARIAATISGTRSVTSARFRVKTRTSSPSRWIWIRAPSSFHSTAAGRIRSKADGMSSADCASIGCRGVRSESRKPRECLAPSADARPTRRRRGRRSASRRAGPRGAARRRPVETASTITPSRAPWRISPIRSPRRNACSSAVARANRSWSAVRRAAWEPAPASEPIRASAASTSSSSSVAGAGAGGGRSFRDAHPTPIDPCGSTPER